MPGDVDGVGLAGVRIAWNAGRDPFAFERRADAFGPQHQHTLHAPGLEQADGDAVGREQPLGPDRQAERGQARRLLGGGIGAAVGQGDEGQAPPVQLFQQLHGAGQEAILAKLVVREDQGAVEVEHDPRERAGHASSSLKPGRSRLTASASGRESRSLRIAMAWRASGS